MAKYNRFDPRNKKKDRHKNQYLDRSAIKKKAKKDEVVSVEQYFGERVLSEIK